MNTYQRLFLQAILFGLVLAPELELLPGNTEFTQFIGPNAYINGVLVYMLVCVATYCNVKSTSSKWIEAIPLGFAIVIQVTVAGNAIHSIASAANSINQSMAATVLLLALHTTGLAGWYLRRLWHSSQT